MRIIDYGHLRDGVLYHGTLSDLDGTPKATWTYEERGAKVTRDRPLDGETFRALWEGVVGGAVFRRHHVRDPNRAIDPEAYHVIYVEFRMPGVPEKRYLILVPAGETDPDFVRWLEALDVPQGSA
jgi:hypothetical protein